MNTPTLMQSEERTAPWNQSEPFEKKFDVTCCQTLSKTVQVLTENYIPGAAVIEYDRDDEGNCFPVGYQEPDDTSDTNWSDEYHANDYHSPIQLIELFGDFLKQQKEVGTFFKSEGYTNWLIKECSNWTEDETEYVEG